MILSFLPPLRPSIIFFLPTPLPPPSSSPPFSPLLNFLNFLLHQQLTFSFILFLFSFSYSGSFILFFLSFLLFPPFLPLFSFPFLRFFSLSLLFSFYSSTRWKPIIAPLCFLLKNFIYFHSTAVFFFNFQTTTPLPPSQLNTFQVGFNISPGPLSSFSALLHYPLPQKKNYALG